MVLTFGLVNLIFKTHLQARKEVNFALSYVFSNPIKIFVSTYRIIFIKDGLIGKINTLPYSNSNDLYCYI